MVLSILILWGCEGASSSSSHRFFTPIHLAAAPNPDNPAQAVLYVGNPFTGLTQFAGASPSNSTITVIDLPGGSPRSTPIVTGGILQDFAVSADGKALFVSHLDNTGAGSLVSYSTSGGFTITAQADLPGLPGYAAVSPVGDSLFVVTSDPEFLLVFSTVTFTQEAQIPLSFTPTVLGVSPTGAVLMGNPVSGTVEYYFPSSSLESFTGASLPTTGISLGGRPGGLSFSPDGSLAYATVSSAGKVMALDLIGVQPTSPSVSLGGIPEGIGVALTATSLVFVANENNILYAVDMAAGTVAKPIVLGGGVLREVALSGSRVYVTDSLSSSIDVVDAEKWSFISVIQ